MKIKIMVITSLVILLVMGSGQASEHLQQPEKIIAIAAGQIPQAPRVSPDGKNLAFEYYTKNKTSLWHAATDGKDAQCLTCEGRLASLSLENASWHPSGSYLVFNEVPEGNFKQKGIYIAAVQNGKLEKQQQVSHGARPQFSHPHGTVIFYETTESLEGYANNILAYQILGQNPLQPDEGKSIELRGPIQQVNRNAEISHPSLAPDGTTIVFAARTTNIKSDQYGGVVLNDIDRQKIYKLWQELIKIDKKKIRQELETIGVVQDESGPGMTRDEFEGILKQEKLLGEPTLVQGYTKRQLFLAWTLGLIEMLDLRYAQKVQEMIFPRLWSTDVFGAPVVPLVKDAASAPLPQKWPTVSHDGKFVVFEAGLYSNRHIYLIAKKGDTWMNKAIKITESGSYNSSPEIDPKGEWLYFESNRDGSKGIWRAKLNWKEINRKLGL
jgi:hypothetical protein